MVKLGADFLVRFVTTWMMIFFFFYLSYVGCIPIVFLTIVCQVAIFKELMNVAVSFRKAKDVTSFGLLPWYFFIIALWAAQGKALMPVVIASFPGTEEYFKVHTFTSFMLYLGGFVGFVATLRRPTMLHQFAIFAWVHMFMFLVILQSATFTRLIMEGMIWFMLATSVVITNDIWAYMCGRMWGKRQLIALSPKKTIEGFFGAVVFTIAFGLLFATVLSQWERMYCPVKNFWDVPTCEAPYSFRWREYQINLFGALPKPWVLTAMPIQLHSMVLSLFAGLIAPFGGFFASGLKRAFDIKDFGTLIPGHGGVTDRMDCQMMMSTFTYTYLSNVVMPVSSLCASAALMGHCVGSLPADKQKEILLLLANQLNATVTF